MFVNLSELIESQPFDFQAWESLAHKIETQFDHMLELGETILKATERLVDMTCLHTQIIDFEGYQVPCVNASVLHSEVCNELLNRHPEAKFSMSFFVDEKRLVKTSLRCRDDFDVSVIALRYGGGGHKRAAGCTLTKNPGA